MAEPQHPDFYNKTRTARKIIVVDLGFLGDSIHLIPALWEIKSHYPQAELDVFTTEVGAEVLSLAACVHESIIFPLGPKSPPWWRHWGILKELRSRGYDLLFNFSGADRTVFISFVTGAKWRMAQQGSRQHFWSKLAIPVWVDRQNRKLPVFEQRRQVLAQCGMQLKPVKFDLRPISPATEWAAHQFTFPFLHFSINASSHIKEWPLEHWVSLAAKLLETGKDIHIVATGSGRPREQEKIRLFVQAVNNPRIIVLEGPLSVQKLTALLLTSLVHVGADSGVLHLASAAGIPTVSIFRKYDGLAEWAPSGPHHFRAEADCSCIQKNNYSCSENTGALCLRSIEPALVLDLVNKALLSLDP
ncbi:MAG: lipopolysaccharide heptosyltransferase [Verrucomicrobiales bacterium]|jgi:heptosyltransferase-1|nr:lipopolysaccharide heptosyltransferase [Verrucomicrobiales bacterium]